MQKINMLMSLRDELKAAPKTIVHTRLHMLISIRDELKAAAQTAEAQTAEAPKVKKESQLDILRRRRDELKAAEVAAASKAAAQTAEAPKVKKEYQLDILRRRRDELKAAAASKAKQKAKMQTALKQEALLEVQWKKMMESEYPTLPQKHDRSKDNVAEWHPVTFKAVDTAESDEEVDEVERHRFPNGSAVLISKSGPTRWIYGDHYKNGEYGTPIGQVDKKTGFFKFFSGGFPDDVFSEAAWAACGGVRPSGPPLDVTIAQWRAAEVDASVADAAEVDASVADAAEVDASVADAADAAEVDASVADAAEVDASVADAAEVDASVADAAEVDASVADAAEAVKATVTTGANAKVVESVWDDTTSDCNEGNNLFHHIMQVKMGDDEPEHQRNVPDHWSEEAN
jgi:hypothetical protein